MAVSYTHLDVYKRQVLEDYPDANICVIDSKQNTVTQALLIDQFVRMLEDGLSFEQAMSKLDALIASARIFFTVGSLDYLKTVSYTHLDVYKRQLLTFGTVSSMDFPDVVTSSIITTLSPSFNLLPRKLPLSAPWSFSSLRSEQ